MSEPDIERGAAAFADLDGLAIGLEEQAPDAGPIAPLKKLGSGFFSLAVETASGVVFRVGLVEEVGRRHHIEAQVLPWLRTRLPLPIPLPEWRIRPGPRLPFGAIGYRRLPGTALTRECLSRLDEDAIARQLGSFIFALEQVPPDEAQARGAPGRESRRIGFEQTRDAALPLLRGLLAEHEYQEVTRFWDHLLDDPAMYAFEPVLTHGDLGDGNILVDEGTSQITGVVDWEFVSVGDPAQNFRGVYPGSTLDSDPRGNNPDTGFASRVFAAFEAAGGRVDEGLNYRLWRDRQVSTFYGILFAARIADRAAMRTLIGRLRERDVLTSYSNTGLDFG